MNLHPDVAATLMAERERELSRRAEQHRMAPRRERPIPKVPWLGRGAGRVERGAVRSSSS